MAFWVITVEYGAAEGHGFAALARFEATRDEARAELYRYACAHRHRPGLRQRGREVFRETDDAYYVRVTGAISTHDVRYRLAELVHSTGEVPEPRGNAWRPPPGDIGSQRPTPAGEPTDATPDYWRAPDE